MEIMKGEKVLLEIPLPSGIEAQLDNIEAFLQREKRYTWQVLMIAILLLFLFMPGKTSG